MAFEKASHQTSRRVGVIATNHPGGVKAMFTVVEVGDVVGPLKKISSGFKPLSIAQLSLPLLNHPG